MPSGKPVVVGRDDELRAAETMLADAERGAGGTIVLTGEAGIGKSTLAQAITERASDRRHRVLAGRCLPIEGLVYDGFVDAVRSLESAETMAFPNELTDRRAAAPANQGRVVDTTADALATIAEPSPVLLLIDDLHWAHQTTRDLFVRLSRRLANTRVTLLTTVRVPDESPHPIDDRGTHRQLAEWWRMPWVTRFELHRFGDAELALQLADVLGERPDRERLRQVMRRSGGNPLFAREVALAGETRLPTRVRDVLSITIDGLPESTLRPLRVCAVAGRQVHHRLVEEVVELDAGELVQLLRPAVDAEVLLTDGEGSWYEFRHALFAETIVAGMLPGEARPIHRMIADALERDESLAAHSPRAEIVHHRLGSGDHERALGACVAAADEAEVVNAAAAASNLLQHALDLWDLVDDPVATTGMQRCDILHRAAWFAEWAGQNALAQERMRAAIDDHTGPDAGLGAHYATLAEIAARGAPPPDFTEVVERALALVPSEPLSSDRARAHLVAGWYWDRQPDRTLTHVPEALRIAEAIGHHDLQCQAMVMLGGAMVVTGRTDEGISMARRGQAIAAEHELFWSLLASHIPLSAMLMGADRIDEGVATALAGLDLASHHDGPNSTVPWLAAIAMSGLVHAGRWDEAEGLATETDGDGFGTSWLLVEYARLLAFRGQHEHAAETLSASHRIASGAGGYEIAASAWVSLHAGDAASAWHAIDESFRAGQLGPPAMVAERATIAVTAAVQLVAAGAPDPGVDAMLERASIGEVSIVGRAWCATAVAECSRFDGADPDAWRTADAAWRATGQFPHMVAYSQLRLGQSTDSPREASDVLGQAHAAATRLRAEPLRASIEEVAATRSVTLPGVAVDPVASLTRREREVLGLLAEGYDNRRVGRSLGIAEKTASVHVSNLLRKLGLGSRTEAAVFALRNGET